MTIGECLRGIIGVAILAVLAPVIVALAIADEIWEAPPWTL